MTKEKTKSTPMFTKLIIRKLEIIEPWFSIQNFNSLLCHQVMKKVLEFNHIEFKAFDVMFIWHEGLTLSKEGQIFLILTHK